MPSRLVHPKTSPGPRCTLHCVPVLKHPNWSVIVHAVHWISHRKQEVRSKIARLGLGVNEASIYNPREKSINSELSPLLAGGCDERSADVTFAEGLRIW